ncbi:MAG: PfaD family polyunsaturated fatty acid/polyketide biosynthesis protein [Thermodesulfobacteriota bacterium]
MSKNRYGYWIKGDTPPEPFETSIDQALLQVNHPLFVVALEDRLGVAMDGSAFLGKEEFSEMPAYAPMIAYVPPLHPMKLGASHFKQQYGLRYAYVTGAMANGIASVEMVQAAGKSGMLGFFGSGGLSLEQIESAIERLRRSMGDLPYGFNLIHSLHDPELEIATVRLYLRHGIKLVEAAAFMRLTLPLVYYRVTGIHQDSAGRIVCPNHIIAKVSRTEVARQFFSPPPEKIIRQLLGKGMITETEASLAGKIPMADAITAEADSGGHTDNRPALALLPTMIALRDEMAAQHQYPVPLHVGLGGGIATPESTAAAFAMGAAYVLTGSVNQACVEAGTSETVRQMLTEAGQADVTMAPAADMFEMGVKVQVLKRGTMFPVRAAKLYEFYNHYKSFYDIPEKDRTHLEKNFFHCGFEEEWRQTKAFFQKRDPKQIERAEADAKHKMALVFRSYLGRSSNWAVTGDPARQIDYQIWCGPAIGAFNEWVKGTFLEKPGNRNVATVALNLLLGASVATRVAWFRNQGISFPIGTGNYRPLPLEEIIRHVGMPPSA